MSESPEPVPPAPRILLVEDELDQAHLLRFLLEADGRYRVTHAQDGVRGMELAQAGGWALVITDINLPGQDGLRVMASSREHHPETPILATTAYTDPGYHERARSHGAHEVLIKPLDRDVLLEVVASLVEREAVREEDGGHQVLAFSARPGDVEVGLAGCLLRHRERGDRVALLVLGGHGGQEDATPHREAAKTTAREMGARIFTAKLPPLDDGGESEVARLIQGAIDEFAPTVSYVPSLADETRTCRVIHDLFLTAGEALDRIFAFPGATATPSFRPRVFVPLGPFLEAKIELARHYRTRQGRPPPYLEPDFLRAQAIYWGRYAGFGAAEALEVLKGGDGWVESDRGDTG